MARTTTPPESDTVSVAAQLRDLLSKATPADVEELDKEIAAMETETAKLRANRKLLAQAVGMEEPKKQWGARKPKPTGSAGTTATGAASRATSSETPPAGGWDSDLTPRRKIVWKHLRAVGSCSMDTLSAATRISRQGPGNLSAVLRHEWFHVNPDNMVSLTDKGDRAQV